MKTLIHAQSVLFQTCANVTWEKLLELEDRMVSCIAVLRPAQSSLPDRLNEKCVVCVQLCKVCRPRCLSQGIPVATERVARGETVELRAVGSRASSLLGKRLAQLQNILLFHFYIKAAL